MKFPLALRRMLIGYLVLHLLAVGFFVLVLTYIVRNQMIRDAQSRMSTMTSMLSEHISELKDEFDEDSLLDHLTRLGKKTDMRFTLIRNDGTVAVDSITGVRDIGPHGTREEILLAKDEEVGFSERYSTTLEKPMMYFARKYHLRAANDSAIQPNRENQSTFKSSPQPPIDPGYIRVAVPSVSINSAIRSIQAYVWVFAIALSALTAFIMAIFSARSLQPLTLFTQAARRIGVGKYNSAPAVLHRTDEWGELGDAFKQMQTELTRREDRLVENSQRLEAVLSSMIEGVLAIAPTGEVMLANGAACEMLSISHVDLVGRKLLEIVRIPELRLAIEQAQLQRTFSKTEFKTLLEPQRTILVRVAMLANKEKSGVAVVLHDVTELRQLETMRRDFVANVSHELKTPLSSIKAYAETLRLGALYDTDKNLSFVEQIESQAELLNKQILDLIQLARVESGKEAYQITDVDLSQTCTQCSKQLSTAAKDADIELMLDLADEPIHAQADHQAIETLVTNLVVNAIHYTPAGGSVTIATRREDEWSVLEVRDTGIGIAPDQQARIFERFYRVDKARSRDKGGTGLGLAIVKHLTQAFGGNVKLESQLGKGSNFIIRLPAINEDSGG
ncbi:MAG: ATP-binding protein [Mariniblastus sp.]